MFFRRYDGKARVVFRLHFNESQVGNETCLKMADDFSDDDSDVTISEKDVKQLQALMRGFLVRHQLNQVRREYEEIFRDIENSEKLFVEWPRTTPCLPSTPRKPKPRKQQQSKTELTEEASSESRQKDTNIGSKFDNGQQAYSDIAALSNKQDVMFPEVCHSETQTSFIEIPLPGTQQKNSTSSQVNAFEIDEIQKPSFDGHVTSQHSHVISISSYDTIPQEPIETSTLRQRQKDSQHESPTPSIPSVGKGNSELLVVSAEDNYVEENSNESQVDKNWKTETNIKTLCDGLDEIHCSETNLQDLKNRSFEEKVTNDFDDRDYRKKATVPLEKHDMLSVSMVTPIKHKQEDSALTSITMATSVWDSFTSATEQDPQNYPKDTPVYPSDPQKLMEIRKNVAMELLWVQQAINSRKNYLKLKSKMSQTAV